MFPLPDPIILLLNNFAPLFSPTVWGYAVTLVIGAILSPGKRTVTAALRITGLSDEKHFINYHRVLSRAKWSGLAVSQILLGLLVALLLSANVPLILIADDTLERRRGKKIKPLGVFRDAARSSAKHKVTSFGLRWVCMTLLVPVPWSRRPWALPFLTALAPAQRTQQALGKRHKSTVDWVIQMLCAVRRWFPKRAIILLVDGGYAAVKLGVCCAQFAMPVTFVSRLRLDAALYDPAPPPDPHRKGRKPQKGKRQKTLRQRAAADTAAWLSATVTWYGGQTRLVQLLSDTALWYAPGLPPLPIRWVLVRDPEGKFKDQAFLCTDLLATPSQIVAWVVLRWNIEVTFEEVRAHLGVETQRQWSDLAIARTTPALLGLFSFVTLLAVDLAAGKPLPLRTSAWYQKDEATFADCLAFVRQQIWRHWYFVRSTAKAETVQLLEPLPSQLWDGLCYVN